MTDPIAALAKMREPFPPNQISKLPKPLKRDAPKGKCSECGGYHGLPAVHLDYVGHAALTDRLLDADPMWTWEPATPDGLPALDRNGGMWIKLTVAGVTRLGYGAADGKQGGDAVKEVIGDALRNAAMRFGAALDLWHKGDLHAVMDHAADEEQQQNNQRDDRGRRDNGGNDRSGGNRSDEQQRQRGGQDQAQQMKGWVHRQIETFKSFTAPADFDKLSNLADDREYKNLKARVATADRALHAKLDDAERAAFQRTDDVPF